MEKAKLLLLVATATLLSATASLAQTEFGTRQGLFFSRWRYFIDDDRWFITDAITGLEFGVFANIKLGKGFSFQPEINLLQKGSKVTPPYNPSKTVMNVSEVVTTFSYEIREKRMFAVLSAGPFYSYAVNGTAETGSGKRDLEFDDEVLKRHDAGIAAGGGIGCIFGRTRISVENRYRHSIFYTVDAPLEDFKLSTKNMGWGYYVVVKTRLFRENKN